MKALILMPIAEQRGGAEQLLRVLLSQMKEQEGELFVVFFEDGPLCTECKALGIPTTVVPAGRLRDLSRFFPTVRQIVQISERIQPNIIFSWMAKAHLYGAAASWMTGIPSAWYQHGLPRSATWLNRLVSLLPASAILACSKTVAEVQQRRWPQSPTEVVHPCVQLDRFDPSVLPSPNIARSTLNLPTDGPLIGMVGRLQRWKGMHTLIDAMPRILALYPDAHAVIVGGRHDLEPEYLSHLEEKILASDLGDHVLLAGFQSNVPLWMQAMDIVIHASDNEPFGIVILEAMALGKPVVAGASGGPREIITEGENGLFAPFDDHDKLAEQITRLLDEPGLVESIGIAAQKRARDFSPTLYAQRFIDVLDDTTVDPSSEAPLVENS